MKLNEFSQVAKPDEVLLVVDAMTGQEAANLVKSFNDDIGITGAVLTKMDGDTRGGAALTIREISGRPIKFTGVGEKMEALVRVVLHVGSSPSDGGSEEGGLGMVKYGVRPPLGNDHRRIGISTSCDVGRFHHSTLGK